MSTTIEQSICSWEASITSLTLALALALCSFVSITPCCAGFETSFEPCLTTSEEDMISGGWLSSKENPVARIRTNGKTTLAVDSLNS